LQEWLEPVASKSHAAPVVPTEIGRLLRKIRGYTGRRPTVIALELAPLLFVRPGELRAARWEHIDWSSQCWRLPAPLTKQRAPHLVPLSIQALMLLYELHPLTGDSPFLFPALGNRQHCMSDGTINKALRTLRYRHHQLVGHGFRTIASTLLSELGWPEHLIEHQLGHADSNKIRRIYNHAQYLLDRTRMMQIWADYLDGLREGRTDASGIGVYRPELNWDNCAPESESWKSDGTAFFQVYPRA
jgi:integrase